MRNNILFAVRRELFNKMFSEADLSRIRNICDVIADVPENADKEYLLEHISNADIAVSSWQTARFDSNVMAKAEKLKLLCHAAGSVKPQVSDELWANGVRVTGAASAIAYGVAEFCLGLILTVPKRVFWGALGTRGGKWRDGLEVFGGPFEIYQQKIGIIGASYVGKHLIKLLKNFSCEMLLYDPYFSYKDAEKLGVVKVETLEDLFSQCMVVSLNAPHTDETNGMIRGKHFQLLPDGAVFINTARANIVNQEEMIRELRNGRFVACIDVVTSPEPPALEHPLRRLSNVLLTPHEAGAIAENLLRIGKFVADEIERFLKNEDLLFEAKSNGLSQIG